MPMRVLGRMCTRTSASSWVHTGHNHTNHAYLLAGVAGEDCGRSKQRLSSQPAMYQWQLCQSWSIGNAFRWLGRELTPTKSSAIPTAPHLADGEHLPPMCLLTHGTDAAAVQGLLVLAVRCMTFMMMVC